MSLQDIILTITNIIISVSLIPQIIDGFKTKTGPVRYGTSIPYFICLATIAGTYASLGLWISTIVTSIAALLWACLAVQRYIYTKPTVK